MHLDRPTIRRLRTDPPISSVPPSDEPGFAWFIPGGSALVVPDPLPHDPDLWSWGRLTLTLVLEVLAQRRRVEHLSTRITPSVARYITAHLPPGRVRVPQARLVRVRLCQPHADAGELAAVYRAGHGVRALAARADRSPDGQAPWVLTALRLV